MSRRLALLVGAASYEDDRLTTLRTPVHDVDGLERVLADPDIGGFTVTKLIDETDATVRRAVGRFLREADRRDTLLVFFGCHGVTDHDGQLYLTSQDTDAQNLEVTALSAELLNRLIDRSPSRRVILILDCCFSGAISRSMTRRDLAPDLGAALAGWGEGRAVLTASRAEEYAWEPTGDPFALLDNPQHSVFAEALVGGLRTGEADVDGDGEVSVEDLYQYTYARVRAAGSYQTPSRWIYSHGTLFVAHRAPTRSAAPAGPAAPAASRRVPSGARSPWDARLLNWRHAVSPEVGLEFRRRAHGGAESQGWGALLNGQPQVATAAFDEALDRDRGSAVAWWGRGICHAVDAAWPSAADCFERSADLIGDEDSSRPLYCGAMLLGAVALVEAHPARARDLLDAALERVPCCPELLAYRGVLLDRRTDLANAFQLAPRLIADFGAVQVDVGAAATDAVGVAEHDLAVLAHVLAGAAAVRGAGTRPPPARPDPSTRVDHRLEGLRGLVERERRKVVDENRNLHILADALLAKPANYGTMALIRSIRELISAGSAALGRTDRPTSVDAMGIPHRAQRLG